jgi:hypothetical protein
MRVHDAFRRRSAAAQFAEDFLAAVEFGLGFASAAAFAIRGSAAICRSPFLLV